MNSRTPLRALAALLLAGCTVGPDYTPPDPDRLPAAWVEAAARGGADSAAFWRAFDDPVLDDLVARALARNPDVAAARSRVVEAQVRARAAGSERWPKIDVTAAFSNSRFSSNGFLASLPAGGGAVFPGQQIDLYQGGVDASWELDLFGARRRDVEAADADAAAAVADSRAVLLGLCAAVTDGYVELRGVEQRLRLAAALRDNDGAALAVLRERAAAGVANDVDVARAEQAVAARDAELQALRAARATAAYVLDRLLGQEPGHAARSLPPAGLPAARDVFAVDVPAATLARRPDVQAAEQRLHAATARIGLATADLYPRLSLTGSFGFQAQRPADLPDWDSRLWLIGPALRWPVFDFGRVRARIDVADARAQGAFADYRGTVLQALADVEVALVRLARCREQAAALQGAAAAAAEAHRLVGEQFDRGVREYLDVLDTERGRLLAERDLVGVRLALAHDAVALAKALGGGWQAAEALAAPADAVTAGG